MTDLRAVDYLDHAERFAGREFSRRDDLDRLLRAAREPDGAPLFDEVLFLAKFCDRAFGIIRRTGPGSDEVVKLTAELASATGRITALIGTLLTLKGEVGREGGGIAEHATAPSDHASFAKLRILIGELATLKNFELQGQKR